MSALYRPALAAVAVLLGLTACGSTASSAPISASRQSPASAPATRPSSVPATKPAEKSPGPEHGSGVCPPAKEFEKLVDLPKGWHFTTVKCWKSWATAAPEGPNPGDGIYLFRFEPSAGWVYHSQGSGYMCSDLGIHEPAPFCQYP